MNKIFRIFYSVFFLLIVIVGFSIHFVVAGILMWFFKDPEYAHIKLTKPLIKLGFFLGLIKIKTTGLENLPQDGPYIIMSNHQSLLDVLVYLAVVPHKIGFIPKKELLNIPILGWDIILQGHFPIDRNNPRLAGKTLDRLKLELINGRVILFFPEGTRTKDGSLGEFKRGGFLTALETGIPIIPALIQGSLEINPKKKILLNPGEISVKFGKLIKVNKIEQDSKEQIKNNSLHLMQTVKNEIESLK